MPRCKIQMKLIDKEAARRRTFNGRKEGLGKKARELSILCDVDVALVCAAGPGGGGGAPEVREFGGAGVIDRYCRLPADKRAKHTHLGYLNAKLAKEKDTLATERQEGPKALAPPGKAALESADLEEMLASIDAALLATEQRRRELGVAGGGQAAVVPLEQGVPLAGGDAFDDMEAWLDELTWQGAEPLPINATMAVQPASGGVFQHINGVEPRPINASVAPPASGVPYTNGGSGMDDMGGIGNQFLQQMAGNGGENDHGQLAWGAYQLQNAVSCPDYGLQYTDSSGSSSDMNGYYSQMPVTSNANAYDGCWYDQAMLGADESSCDAVVPAEYYLDPSLDITGNPAYMPPKHFGMGTDCFTGVSSPIGLDDGSFMDASGQGYGTQCLADYFQCPDASQQFGDEPLHYLSDVAQGISYYDNLEAGSCGNGRSELFDHSHSSSGGSVQFGSELSQPGVLEDQDSGVHKFWLMEQAAGFY
ncbi:unnamed protein product [Urochloa decumbens]|uniref:MADS-box domain-containing protein n=1 Tax=Urochloa decumbens TaxID=240449 RepID=A0ABC8YP74_9POAL